MTFFVQVSPAVLLFLVVVIGAAPAIAQGRMLLLGASAFYTAGAFSSAWVISNDASSGNLSLIVGSVAGCLTAILLALLVSRLRGDYFALATLCFAELLRLALVIQPPFPGPEGIADVPRGKLLWFSLASAPAMAIGASLLLAACTAITSLVVGSPWGAALQATHDHEVGARSSGLPVEHIRLTALAYAGAWAGAAGALGVRYLGLADVETFALPESIMVLVVLLLGGRPSIGRCLAIGAIIASISELLRFVSTGAVRQIFFGAALFALALVLRDDLRVAEGSEGCL